MREILFAGKEKDTNEWAVGFFVSHEDEAYIFEPSQVRRGIDFGGYLDCCQMTEVRPETVCQFSGLHDKNGRKIFEGDIVKGRSFIHIDRTIYQVVYEQNGFYYHDEDGVDWHPANIDDAEIVGNIYDNPELMEEKENE